MLIPLLLLGCTDDDASEDDDTGEEAVLIGAGIPWPDKTDEEKASWMTFQVLPVMKPLFVEHDPIYETTFDCDTCHGTENVSDFSTMPHPLGPPELSISDWPEDSTDPEIVAMAAFMDETVVPTIAQLIDSVVAPSPTAEGVKCSTCHEIGP